MSIKFLPALVIACAGLGVSLPAQSQISSLQQGGMIAAAMPRLDFTSEEFAFATAIAGDPMLAAFYGGNGLKPVFTGPDGQARRDALKTAAQSMREHGIPAARYRLPSDEVYQSDLMSEIAYARVLANMVQDLQAGVVRPQDADSQIHREIPTHSDFAVLMREFADHGEPAAFLAGLSPQIPAYRVLQAALREQQSKIADIDLPKAPDAVWYVGMSGDGVVPLRQRLASIGFGADSTDPRSYDHTLAEAVSRYQKSIGLPADGVAGPNTIRRLNADDAGAQAKAIMVAMERLRWMGRVDLNARHVWVNIPEYTARIMENGYQVFQTRVVVGKNDSGWRTPEFSDQMEYIVVNPSWSVPRSITAKEYLPKLQANPYAVSHLDIVDRKGNVIPREHINFAAYTGKSFPFFMRQKPGSDNALGIVKFIFPNKWNIYLHDTPSKSLFANTRRAYSHGCVRVGDPRDFAYQLLSQQTDNPKGVFQRALDSGRETYLKLTPNLPVHLVYFTAYPDESGEIRYFSDVYGRDARIWELLKQAGLDSDV